MQAGDMTGRVALVTGAAAGLGRATAIRLARAGAALCLVDIDQANLDEAAQAIRDEGAGALVHVADLSQHDACTGAVAGAVAAFGRLDALCNVAGVMIPAHTPQMSVDAYNRTIAINLSAPFFLAQAAIPHLLEAKGAIVNVTSCAAYRGQAYFAAYCATKAGLTHMTKALAMEYMHQPIRINAVAPGGMMTVLAGNIRLLEDGDRSLLQRIGPLRGLVEIDEVADVVAFLATDAARAFHGACINVDKGITAD
ncbi:SDR family oxidoreductase [Sphingobium sufflavum]|uniref:SDR family NAD(P)-dependent oxidoreductase n=1 Tax=Sphingobium sufflavum TaxID=1129547 RepID=UPI001F3CD6EC|nr:SDR family oxidoreductase [Sphingobium sufflavum]MCE7796928.1 SDR family oxidoreductase [Sphingobium sufflavum]